MFRKSLSKGCESLSKKWNFRPFKIQLNRPMLQPRINLNPSHNNCKRNFSSFPIDLKSLESHGIVRDIMTSGNKILFKKSVNVDMEDPDIPKIVSDLYATIKNQAEDTVGIAAPQIGINKRIILVPESTQLPIKLVPLFNISYKVLTDDYDNNIEGCLSLPNLVGIVPRALKIELKGIDHHGKEFTRIEKGELARIYQHEVDHLDGILYTMRMKDLSKLCYEENMNLDFLADADLKF